MAHRSLTALVFSGFTPTTTATLISMLGDDGLPDDIRIVQELTYQPWQTNRSGLLVIGMGPNTDLAKVSHYIQDRTTWWDVVVALTESIWAYEPALLAQGAVKVIPHPEDELARCRDELRNLLSILSMHMTDILGLELADLLQLYGDKRVPKTIRICGDGVIGSIYMRNGNIVHAETIDEIEGVKAFNRLFAVKSPEIRVHNGCLTSRSTVNQSVMSVMLEGARINDEVQRESIEFIGQPVAPSAEEVSESLSDIFEELDIPLSGEVPKDLDMDLDELDL